MQRAQSSRFCQGSSPVRANCKQHEPSHSADDVWVSLSSTWHYVSRPYDAASLPPMSSRTFLEPLHPPCGPHLTLTQGMVEI